MTKDKTQRILASLVMGLNCFNSLAPLAAVPAVMDGTRLPQANNVVAKGEADSATATCYQVLELADQVLFGRAEAFTTPVGEGNTTSSVTGETVVGGAQIIKNGGTATDYVIKATGVQIVSNGGLANGGTIEDGRQDIYNGGTGTVTTMNGGTQCVYNGGTGIVTTINGGTQTINYGGTGTVSTISGGTQYVSDGGKGIVTTMEGGTQRVYYGGTGTVTTMKGGTQYVLQMGTVDTMSGGTQYVANGGTGTVTTMEGGTQNVVWGGKGTVATMSGGDQYVSNGGTGTVTTMNSGNQTVFGTGTVTTMSSGNQTVYNGGTGIVTTMEGGTQTVRGMGTVNTMSGGVQDVYSGGTSIVSAVVGGTQNIYAGGTGTASVSAGGVQIVSGKAVDTTISASGEQILVGTEYSTSNNNLLSGATQGYMRGASVSGGTIGSVRQKLYQGGTSLDQTIDGGTQAVLSDGYASGTIMSGGSQLVYKGGTTSVASMTNGAQQFVEEGATATVTDMSGTTMSGVAQYIRSGGLGTVSTITASGGQFVDGGGTGIVDTMQNGAIQEVSSGGTGIIGTMNSGAMQTAGSGGTARVSVMNVNTLQVVSVGGTGTVTTMSAGMQYVYVGGKGTVTALNGGTQMVYSGGTSLATTINSGGTMLYGAGAQAEDTTVNGGTIQLEDVDKAGGTVYALGNVTATDGIINVAANDYAKKDYSTANRSLSLTSLTGTATFVINTDLANNTGDTISIGTANNATANIKVGYDPFYDIATKNQTLSGTYQVLSKGSGTLTVNSVQTDWGALRFTPTIVDNGDGTYSTVAIKENSFDPSENIMTAADARAVLNEAWFQTVNSLSKRLGDIRSNNNSEDGIWARFQRSNNKAKGDREAKLNGNLFQIGYDKAFSRADGKTYVGVAVDHLDGTGSYANGSGKTKGTSFAIYDTWMGHTGHYYDVVARYGHFSNDYTLTDLSETISDADYGVNAWSLSGEYGYRKQLKNGMYIEPQGEIIYGRVGSGDYTTSLKWPVSVDATNHFITRLGIAVGKESKNSSYYAKASYYHDFAGGGQVLFDEYNYEREAVKNWGEVTLGGDVKLSHNGKVYGELTKYFGDRSNSLNYNVGFRWNF